MSPLDTLLIGRIAELLPADRCFVHQPPSVVNEHSHPLAIAGLGLCTSGRTGAGTGRGALGTGFGLHTGGDGHSRNTGVEFKVAAGKVLKGTLILEKDQLAEGLPTQLKTDGPFEQFGDSGRHALRIHLTRTIGASDADATLAHGGKYRVTVAVVKKWFDCIRFLKNLNRIGIFVGIGSVEANQGHNQDNK